MEHDENSKGSKVEPNRDSPRHRSFLSLLLSPHFESSATFAFICSVFAQPALAQQPEPAAQPTFLLIDNDLKPQPIQVQGIVGGILRYTDALRVERERPLSELLAIAPSATEPARRPSPARVAAPAAKPSPAPTPTGAAKSSVPAPTAEPPLGVVELIDGQRFPGLPLPSAGDILVWDHPRFGALRIPLDEISRVHLSDAPDPSPPGPIPLGPAPSAKGDDEVIFRNGDIVRGLVEEIGATVTISMAASAGAKSGAGTKSQSAIDRVREIRLANKPKAPVGNFVWLHDGTVARMEKIESATEGPAESVLAGTLPEKFAAKGRGLWRVDEMDALVIDGTRLRPLATLPLKNQQPGPGRRRFEPAAAVGSAFDPLWSRDVLLRGPMTIEWELPANPAAITGSLDMPDEALTWGDCEVTVWLVHAGQPTELAHERLHAARPHADLNARLTSAAPGDLLRITVDPGANGHIQDWVDLRRVFVVGK